MARKATQKPTASKAASSSATSPKAKRTRLSKHDKEDGEELDESKSQEMLPDLNLTQSSQSTNVPAVEEPKKPQAPVIQEQTDNSTSKKSPGKKGRGRPKANEDGKGSKDSKQSSYHQLKRDLESVPGHQRYEIYIHRVLKHLHPGCTMSKRAMITANSFVNDMFDRLTQEASKLVKYTEKETLTPKAIQTAVRLIVPGELCRHGVSEALKACHRSAITKSMTSLK